MTTTLTAQPIHRGTSRLAPATLIRAGNRAMARIPEDPIALLGRFSIAAVFWKSGQTKIEGFAVDLINERDGLRVGAGRRSRTSERSGLTHAPSRATSSAYGLWQCPL